MYHQQFYIIANFLMVLDTLIIIATGYMAYSVSLDMTTDGLVMAWYDFLGCILFLMFANNYFLGRRGFYSAKRFPSTWSMLGSLFIAVSLGFVVLSFVSTNKEETTMMYVIEVSKEDLNELTSLIAKEEASLDEKAKKMSKTFYSVRKERIESLTAAIERSEEKGAVKRASSNQNEVALDFDKVYLAKGKKVIKTIKLEQPDSDPLDGLSAL